MANLKCKMCGGALDITGDQKVAVCEYCGTKQTIPKIDSERKMQLYERASHYRRNNEFDKAAGIYEQILNEDTNDAEAYWSLVLCRYGIEYVEDPISKNRIPTVNRAQFTSVFDDENYKQAIEKADISQRVIYIEEAKTINEIQKGILSISQKEEPFDIFICYKETDDSGKRTRDSVLGNELYYQLTEEGFKVFFSRITLEDKIGTAYEPYIFAALNSAKIMVVIGTKPEYFNAPWVKNEWSRYLTLVKADHKKILIPAYRDMDPYDLPEEFSHLQALDMSKLGFMQDLVRGINKLTGGVSKKSPANQHTESIAHTVGESPKDPNTERILIYAKDGDWDKLFDFCDDLLLENPENASAYLGKLMANRKCHTKIDLSNCTESLDIDTNYRKILELDDSALSYEVKSYNAVIKERKEQIAKSIKRQEYEDTQSYRRQEEEQDALRRKLEFERAESARKEETYAKACELMLHGYGSNISNAIALFKSIPDWKDSAHLMSVLETKENVAVKYNEYLSIYPMIREKKRASSVKANLIELLKNTKHGRKGFPKYITVFFVLAVAGLLWGIIVKAVGLLLGGLVFGILSVGFYTLKVYFKRRGIAAAILECEEKEKAFSDIPDFYTFAPEMVQYKTIADEYIAHKSISADDAAMDSWEMKCTEISKRKEAERKNRLSDANENYQRVMTNLANAEDEIKNQYRCEQMQLNNERNYKSDRYNKLGLLQFREKNEIKKRIDEIKERLNSLTSEMNTQLQKIVQERNRALNDLQRRKTEIDKELDSEFPMPQSPENDIKKEISQLALNEAARKKAEELTKIKRHDKEHCRIVSAAVKKYINI